MMKKALICIDRHEAKCSAQLLEVIRRIYDENQVETCAVLFENAPEIESGLFHQVHWFHADDSQYYDVRWLASCIGTLHDTEQFDCIIVPATCWGRMIAPVLAMKLKTGLVADVTDVFEKDGIIQMIRPAFEGKLLARIVNQEASPVLMSVRLGVFQYQEMNIRETQTFTHDDIPACKAGIRLIVQGAAETPQDIRDARILVSGGGGIADHFPELQKFAKLLNAMPSSSRRLVDEGITQRAIQVGQSGKIVSPDLYIALGIYGSMQHMEGLKNVNDIISVNTNKNAPICSLSTIVVEGDAIEFMKELSKKIKKQK